MPRRSLSLSNGLGKKQLYRSVEPNYILETCPPKQTRKYIHRLLLQENLCNCLNILCKKVDELKALNIMKISYSAITLILLVFLTIITSIYLA